MTGWECSAQVSVKVLSKSCALHKTLGVTYFTLELKMNLKIKKVTNRRYGAEPEYGIRKSANNVFFFFCFCFWFVFGFFWFFYEYLIRTNILKIFIFANKRNFISKAAFPHETAMHARWLSEWVTCKDVTDTRCCTQQQRRHGWAKKEWTASLVLLNWFLYLNRVLEGVYNFQEAEFDREINPLRCIIDVCTGVLSCSLCLCSCVSFRQ